VTIRFTKEITSRDDVERRVAPAVPPLLCLPATNYLDLCVVDVQESSDELELKAHFGSSKAS